MAQRATALASIPRGVWALGLVSLCMDLSSETIHALLPLYMAGVLGASTTTIGVIEGVAEAIALVVKMFSGALSDWTRRRKPLVLAGYGLSAATKLIFPLATSLGWVVVGRFADRVGKGIRGAPRDALIADMTPADVRGASFGLRQALDTVGAIGGPLAAIGGMALFFGRFTSVFWIAVVPAALAVLLILFGVHERDVHDRGKPRAPLAWADAKRLPRDFWVVVAIAAVFTLARFSEAFLLLRAESVGFPAGDAPWVMVAMTVVYAASAYPAGSAADRGHGPHLLSAGLASLVVADLLLASASGAPLVLAGAALWGLHMGLTQGLLAALVAASAPADLRGSAFGVFNLASGSALLVASALAGLLWDAAGPQLTFYAGAAFTALAWIALLVRGRGWVGRLSA
jgi:MFS family permease